MSLRPRSLSALAALALAASAPAWAQGTITNTAQLSFRQAGSARSVVSNTVTLALEGPSAPSTPRTLRLMRLANGGQATATLDASGTVCLGQGGGLASPVPAADLGFDPSAAALLPAPSLHLGEPLFIDVSAPDADRDPAARDRIDVDLATPEGDHESLSLQETGPHTGRFVGFIATGPGDTARPGDCRLNASRGKRVTVKVADVGGSDMLTATALIDPYGYVFNSADGQPLDGARITLVDDATGAPARVLGDDGTSAYPSTVVTGQNLVDAGGSRYEYVAGEFRFPRVAAGRYHLRIEPPTGFTAPSSATPEAVARLTAPSGAGGFILSDASWGRSFTLTDGADLHADVPVDGQAGALTLEKTTSATLVSAGDFVQYRLTLKNPDQSHAAAGVQVVDRLPDGFRYVWGSARMNGARVTDPARSADGRTLTFPVGAVAATGSQQLAYVLTLGPDARAGEAVNRAQALGDGGLASNRAQASVRVRSALYDDRITITGRVTEGACEGARQGVGGVRLLLQDGSFAITDADGLYHFDGVRPGLQAVQLDAGALPPGLEARSCARNSRRAGSDISQFVEARDGVLARADFQLARTAASGTTAAATAAASDTAAAGEGRDWFAGLKPGVQWLFPAPDHNPRAPAVKVAIAHAPGQRVDITVDGAPVDAYAKEGETLSADGLLAVTLWRGVPLKEGDTVLAARVLNRDGSLAAELTRRVHYANKPAHAEVLTARSLLTADGLARPVLAVRLTDASGAPVRAGVMGSFKVAAPYAPFVDVADAQQRKLDRQEPGGAAWRVTGDDGVALIALAPTPRAGEVVVDLPLPSDPESRPTQVRAWLQADRKDWVVVGFAAGTAGYDTLSRHVDALNRRHPLPGFADGQLAFYAKGRIKGSWLLTVAYDNKRTADRDRGLMGAIDPDRNYTVYGDASQGGYDAQTTRKLYLRLERREVYALFGDFQTGFDASELGRYDRTLNGLKFERQGRVLSFAGFVADTDQTQVRDEIQGSGLSGPYHLSRRGLVVGAEQISIETRDRLRSERVLAVRTLALHADYDVDYETGALTFTFPVLSRDADGNPNIIVARYETTGAGAKTVQAGGRASARLLGGRVAAGVTFLRDGEGAHAAATDLLAADLKLRPRADTEVRLEAAVSDRDAQGGRTLQTAYIAEAAHHSGRIDVLAYYRREDAAFGVGQQAYSEAGAEKVGLDAKLRLGWGLTLAGSGRRETYAATGATRDAVDARLDWVHGDLALNLGLKLVHDDTALGSGDSRLLTLGAGRWFMDHHLQLTGSTDVSLDGAAASVDFPVRHRLGATYVFSDTLRFTLDHEIAEGAAYTTQTTGAGAEWAPWRGARLTGGLGEQGLGGASFADTDPRTFGRFGLSQSLALGKRWMLDAAVDTTTTLSGRVPTTALVNSAFPSASGATTYASVGQAGAPGGVVVEDFRSVSLGGAYHAERWSWTGRAEARFGATADTWNVSSAVLRQLGAGITALAGVRATDTQTTDGGRTSQGLAEASLAWRPLESRWSVLERLELRHDAGSAGASAATVAGAALLAAGTGDADRLVSNLAVNYDSDGAHGRGGIAAGGFVGAKYVRGRFGDDAYAGFVDVVGASLRYNLSSRIDLGLQGAARTAWAAHTSDFTLGVSVGLSPAANTWISVGWNVAGFRDRDFESNAYTRQGPFVTARLKFDQQTLGGFSRLFTERR